MTFELIFVDAETGKIMFVVSDIVVVRYITPSEVGFTKLDGQLGRCQFKDFEKLEIVRKNS